MSNTSVADRSASLGVRPYRDSQWAGAGVVPFCEAVLHTPTEPVLAPDAKTVELAEYMIDVMHARNGIGLAANQVGLSYRLFVHNLPRLAPEVIINPRIVDTTGEWEYSEGCLSMTVDGTRAATIRPKMITVEALGLDGKKLRITADELLSRVFQHEIDHLDGLVYVQRLKGSEKERVYEAMKAGGVDLSMLTSVPYEWDE